MGNGATQIVSTYMYRDSGLGGRLTFLSSRLHLGAVKSTIAAMRTFAALLLAFWSYSVAADFPTCLSGFNWTFNSLQQSPCEVAAALGEACTGVDFPIPELTPTQNYLGPQPEAANQCRCSTVFYNMLSACAVCQGAEVSTWSFYETNCTQVSVTVFIPPIPSGFAVPHYAYLDPTANGINIFNPQIAQADAGLDSTAVPQPTSTLPPSSGPNGSSGINIPQATAPSSSGGKKSHTGAIAGGVVGGVIAIILIVGLIFFLRRRKPARSAAPFDSDKLVGSESPYGNTPVFPINTGTSAPNRLYDPNDPTTFPGQSTDPMQSLYSSPTPGSQHQQFHPNTLTANHTGATNYTNMGAVSQQNIPHHVGQAGYTGTAEVM